MVNDGCLSFSPVFFDAKRWYEIDTIADLRAADKVCDLYHHPLGVMNKNYVVTTPRVPAYSPVIEPINAIGRTKKATRLHPGLEVGAAMTSVSTLPQ